MNDTFEVVINTCKCLPETCSCDDWAILKNGKIFVTIIDKDKAEIIADALNCYGGEV